MKITPNAVRWSAPEGERAARPLLVLLHGYGSNEGDLFTLAPQLPADPVVASVRAPIATNGGYSWWDMTGGRPGAPSSNNVNAAALAVIDWLDSLEYASVSLFGFSQGAALALQLNRHAPGRFAATVSLAGFVPPGGHAGDAQLESVRPPIFWGRGTLDRVIPAEAVERTSVWLPQHSTPTIRVYENLAHSISAVELTELNEFLRDNCEA